MTASSPAVRLFAAAGPSASLAWTRRRLLAGLAGGLVAGGALLALPGPSLATGSGCDREADDPGLIGDDAWEGPTFGLAVSWDPVRWGVATRRTRDVARSLGREELPVDCGFGQGGSDRLTLVNGMWESGVLLIESYDRLMWTPADMAEAMDHPGWVRNLHVAEGSPLLLAEVAGDTLAAVAGDEGEPGHTVYWQATFPAADDAVIHELTLHLWEAGATYALHDFDGVDIAGIDPFAVLDLEAVEAAIADWLR